MDSNPWVVESIMDFNFFCCPECHFQGKTAKLFEDHALESHPKSKKLFNKTDIKIDTIITESDSKEDFDIDIPDEKACETEILETNEENNHR